ncbi:MAG: NAD(P)H-hydrate dehydratase [Pseudomonadota bacterium]
MVRNAPALWSPALPRPGPDAHKYNRGHSVILGAEIYTGATRLAAEACSRIGSGLVTVLSAVQANTYRAALPADIMVRADALSDLNRATTLLAGPGGCSDEQANALIRTDAALPIILDADAIRLSPELAGRSCILTPHAAEFERYFETSGDLPTDQAQEAARNSGHIVILKGPYTVIAAPNGRVVLNTNASPYLAKAGTGDVLAGLITGLSAQGMPSFEAACASVWIHGEAGKRIGPGLIPQDIIGELRAILSDLLS